MDIIFGYTNITAVYDADDKELTITLVDTITGIPLKNANVVVKVDGNTYKVRIYANGQGILSLADLAPGTYDAIITYKGSTDKYYPVNTTAAPINSAAVRY